MQVDIKTNTVVQLRQTFSHVARRLGGDKPASRYQEATFDMQPTANFHYRPLWEPDRDIYDQRRTAMVMRDWYDLRDPRQYYYGTYTITRARQQEAMEKSLEFVEKTGLLRDLPASVREGLILALLPLRHAEWGANANNCYVTAYGWGASITQATMFHAMDRLGIAQIVSRIGLLLDGSSGDSLAHAKTLWMEDAAWQGIRRLVERMMVTKDWFELHVAQNVVFDGLLHPLLFVEYVKRFSTDHGPALRLLAEFMANWFDETSRWADSTIKIVAAESPANAELLSDWIGSWREQAHTALIPYVAAVFGQAAEQVLTQADARLDARLGKLGLSRATAEAVA